MAECSVGVLSARISVYLYKDPGNLFAQIFRLKLVFFLNLLIVIILIQLLIIVVIFIQITKIGVVGWI